MFFLKRDERTRRKRWRNENHGTEGESKAAKAIASTKKNVQNKNCKLLLAAWRGKVKTKLGFTKKWLLAASMAEDWYLTKGK